MFLWDCIPALLIALVYIKVTKKGWNGILLNLWNHDYHIVLAVVLQILTGIAYQLQEHYRMNSEVWGNDRNRFASSSILILILVTHQMASMWLYIRIREMISTPKHIGTSMIFSNNSKLNAITE
jgi:hypothetical protein